MPRSPGQDGEHHRLGRGDGEEHLIRALNRAQAYAADADLDAWVDVHAHGLHHAQGQAGPGTFDIAKRELPGSAVEVLPLQDAES